MAKEGSLEASGVLIPVSWVVVQHGAVDPLLRLLHSVERHAERSSVQELLVVDNGDTLGEKEKAAITSVPLPVRIVDNASTNYASGINRGVELSTHGIVVVSNNDVELLPESRLNAMAQSLLTDERVGVCVPQLVFPDGSWQQSVLLRGESFLSLVGALLFLNTLRGIHARRLMRAEQRKPRFIGRAPGAFMIVKRPCFEQLRGLDESYSYGEEIDFFFRAGQARWKTVFVPSSVVLHVGGGTDGVPSPRNALGQYESHRKFYLETLGPIIGRAYMKLWLAAYAERALLWSILGHLTKHRRLQLGASLAWSVLRAGRQVDCND